MQLASLPSRPLALAELAELDESGRFRTVLPAAAFDVEGSDHELVPVLVLVTDGRVVGAGYDTDSAGWVRVASADAPDDEEALERLLRETNASLREWAEKSEQAWAQPGEAGVLLEAFRAVE